MSLNRNYYVIKHEYGGFSEGFGVEPQLLCGLLYDSRIDLWQDIELTEDILAGKIDDGIFYSDTIDVTFKPDVTIIEDLWEKEEPFEISTEIVYKLLREARFAQSLMFADPSRFPIALADGEWLLDRDHLSDDFEKTANFYPDDYSPQDIMNAVNEAYQTRVHLSHYLYEGNSKNGMPIRMHIKDGKIHTAYPVRK